jgi:cardiolipin synthase A/B
VAEENAPIAFPLQIAIILCMLAGGKSGRCEWLRTGQVVFPAMLAAIDAARSAICLETYTFGPGELGERFRARLVAAQRRGARVRVLYDALGSYTLPQAFWEPLRSVGGNVRQFNPLGLDRFGIRDHRKLLVCDEEVAFIGGFNIASQYQGDGVTSGWCDIGLRLQGPLVRELVEAFEEMFERADFRYKRFVHLRRFGSRRRIEVPNEQLLLSGPGRGRNPIKAAMRRDLARARSVRIIVAYFLPTWRLRRQLMGVARRGGTVQLILAGKSDVAVSRLAARSLYRRLLASGIEIFEYQPQILHTKLVLIDEAVYAGSANLDQRSLNINYELMVRSQSSGLVEQAQELFCETLKHCRRITLQEWSWSRSFWEKFKQRWAYFILVRLDPFLARRQWRLMPTLRGTRRHKHPHTPGPEGALPSVRQSSETRSGVSPERK